jgi:ribosomal protein S18 acetylase RimI-like enzyme
LVNLIDHKELSAAEEIVRLQKASYIIEAELINFMQIPPILEDPEDIINSTEIYYGYYLENNLAGIISYTIENDVLDICKVAVHPNYFKKGIATQLIKFIQQRPNIRSIIVSTGLKNTPAVNLYISQGFIKTAEREVVEGLFIACFEKQVKHNE